jgi:hypothetical protein
MPYRRIGLPVTINRNARQGRPDRNSGLVCGETLVDIRQTHYGTRETIGTSAHA